MTAPAATMAAIALSLSNCDPSHMAARLVSAPVRSGAVKAFGMAIPIAILGGLIGLGGAEFRLPVLVGPLRYSPRQAVPLNLAVSIITIAASLVIRSRTLSFAPVAPHAPAIIALITGAMIAAWTGAAHFGRLSDAWLERMILALLLIIGVALIVEGFLLGGAPALLPASTVSWIVAGLVFGVIIGLISSLLGVAGGEVIIPTLMFAYGADIKTAGTASLLISLPTVAVGIGRYARLHAYASRSLAETVAPMGLGSVIDAVIGGLLVGSVPATALKIGLGVILIISAWRTFRRH